MNKLFRLKSIVSLMLIFLIIFSAIPLSAVAQGSNATGDCYWEIKYKTLYIKGNGAMADYHNLEINNTVLPPWWGEDFNQIVIEDGVTYIGDYAFDYSKNFTDLTSIIIPKSVTKIGDGAFRNCEFENIILHDNITEIGLAALSGNNIKSIDLPNKLTEICSKLFRNCSFLEEIELNDNINLIGAYAFQNCRSLKSVDFPKSLKTIGDYAFSACYSLGDIVIPGTVETIGGYAFADCTFNNIQLLDGIKHLGSWAFANCNNITKVTIPGTITEIDDYSFENCAKLKEVIISEGVTTLKNGVFKNCQELTSVVLPKSLSKIQQETFRFCTSLEKIIIPSSVTEMGPWAFSDCSSLYDVTLSPNIKNFSGDNFGRCTSLSSLIIPEGVTVVGGFSECTSLKKLVIPKSVTMINTVNCPSLEEIVLNDGLETIYEHTFSGCKSLESIEIPSTVTEIGQYAFKDCERLKEIALPNKITQIKNNVFEGCVSLSTLKLPASVTAIQDDAFKNCTSLSELNFPEGITSIGKLTGCTSLEKIVIPKSVTNLKPLNCPSLKEVVLSEGLKTISADAFNGYSFIQSITIPSTVTEIGSRAFENCINLESVILPDQLSQISSSVFSGCSSLESVVVPKNVWSIDYKAFSGCSSLKEIFLPTSLRKIDSCAFANCTSLKTVSIPKSFVTIGEQAFLNCTSLNDITFSKNISYNFSAPNIFEGCTNLKTVNYLSTYNDFSADHCDLLNISNVNYVTECPNNSHQYDNENDLECNICDHIRQTGEHYFSYSCDLICNGCGLQTSNDPHHVYDDDVDANCNNCGYLKYLHGDINNDKTADLSDVVLLAQKVAGWLVVYDDLASDINFDNAIDLEDVVLLAQYIAGWQVDVYYGNYLKKSDNTVVIAPPENEVIEHNFKNVIKNDNELTYDTIICSDCGLEVLDHGYADGSMNGYFSKVKYYVEGSPVNDNSLHLVIYGEGAMQNYTKNERPMWDEYIHRLSKVTIKNGVTNIGQYAFYGSNNSSVEFEIGDTVKTISHYAIWLPIKSINLGEGVERVELSALHSNIEKVYIPKNVEFVADLTSQRHTWFYGGSEEEFLKIKTAHDGKSYTVKGWLDWLFETLEVISQPIDVYLEADNQFDKHKLFDIISYKSMNCQTKCNTF